MQERRKYRPAQNVAGSPVGKQRAPSFSVSRGALSVSGKGVPCLFDSRSETYSDKRDGVESISQGQRELLLGVERRGIPDVACIKVGDDADYTLLFLRFLLLSGDHFRGTNNNRRRRCCDRQHNSWKLKGLIPCQRKLRRSGLLKTVCFDDDDVRTWWKGAENEATVGPSCG